MIIRGESKQQSRNNPFRTPALSSQPPRPRCRFFVRERTHPYRTSGITRRLPSPLYDIGNPKMRIKVCPLLSSFSPSALSTPLWRVHVPMPLLQPPPALATHIEIRNACKLGEAGDPRKTVTSRLFANRIHPLPPPRLHGNRNSQLLYRPADGHFGLR